MGRPKRYRTGSKEVFNKLKERHPDLNISYQDYIKIIKTFFKHIVDYLIETGDKIRMPYGMGDFYIRKKRQKKYKDRNTGEIRIYKPVNWQASREKGKLVLHNNYHTEGFYFNFAWSPKTSYIKFFRIWQFKVYREYARAFGKLLQKPRGREKHIFKEW